MACPGIGRWGAAALSCGLLFTLLQPAGAATTANFAPGDPPGEWHSQARDYANTRFSTLNQVTAANVATLREAWTFSDGTQNGHEAAPLVADNTMYLVTPFPNISYALDLTKPGA